MTSSTIPVNGGAMPSTIKVRIKTIYGNEATYPVCEKAKALAAIAGQKTLTRNTLTQAMRLGFRVVVVDQFGRTSSALPIAA